MVDGDGSVRSNTELFLRLDGDEGRHGGDILRRSGCSFGCKVLELKFHACVGAFCGISTSHMKWLTRKVENQRERCGATLEMCKIGDHISNIMYTNLVRKLRQCCCGVQNTCIKLRVLYRVASVIVSQVATLFERGAVECLKVKGVWTMCLKSGCL